MKTKILISFISLSLLVSSNFISAQEIELPSPGLTPDSPFYFLEKIAETIGTFFTFGDLKKAERHAVLAAERLAEARAVAEKGKSELAEKTLQRYEMQLRNSMAKTEEAQTKGENAEEVMTRIGQATQKHLEVLAEVYENAPEQTKPAIENAIKASLKEHKRVVEALKERNALGEIPEEVTLPAQVPQEARERIQTRAQQELEIMKALEGMDTSKSLRTLCIEQGGPSEICEQFPAEPFNSFEQVEDFCIKLGGPAEICTSVETQCREYGVTAPNECFLLMMIGQTRTVGELKASPQPESPSREEGIGCSSGYIIYGQTKYCCEDSDRSSSLDQRHYYIKGTLEAKVFNTADGTLISQEIHTDFCDGNRLTEWMCSNRNEALAEEYNCPQGCEDGACKRLHEIMEVEIK